MSSPNNRLSFIAALLLLLTPFIVGEVLAKADVAGRIAVALLWWTALLALTLLHPACAPAREFGRTKIMASIIVAFFSFGFVGAFAWWAMVSRGPKATPSLASDAERSAQSEVNVPNPSQSPPSRQPDSGQQSVSRLDAEPTAPPSALRSLTSSEVELPASGHQPTALDLGGNLDEAVDTSFDVWQPVKGGAIAEVDWGQLGEWVPVAEIVAAATGGQGQVSLYDVDRQIAVATGEISSAGALRLQIPVDNGIRRYRLSVRKFGGGSTFRQLAATGTIVFEPVRIREFRRDSLGGSVDTLVVADSAGPPEQWVVVPSSRRVSVDWPNLPNMSAHIEGTLVISSPTYERGFGSVRLREVMSDEIVSVADWYPTRPPGGIMSAGKPYRPDIVPIRLAVPKAEVSREYVLEVGVKGIRIAAGATARLVITR